MEESGFDNPTGRASDARTFPNRSTAVDEANMVEAAHSSDVIQGLRYALLFSVTLWAALIGLVFWIFG